MGGPADSLLYWVALVQERRGWGRGPYRGHLRGGDAERGAAHGGPLPRRGAMLRILAPLSSPLSTLTRGTAPLTTFPGMTVAQPGVFTIQRPGCGQRWPQLRSPSQGSPQPCMPTGMPMVLGSQPGAWAALADTTLSSGGMQLQSPVLVTQLVIHQFLRIKSPNKFLPEL